MRLYHGTSSRFLERILQRGLVPRGNKRQGNWGHSVVSSPKHVYLTNGYAIHYACAAQKGDGYAATGERLLLVEVDTSQMVPWLLHPDEDFLYQGMRENFPGPAKHATMHERTAWFRDHLHAFQGAWEDSVRMMGTCTVEGTVPARAITRYALVPRTHPLRFKSDPTVGILNHSIMGHFYKALTAHVFGDDVKHVKPEMPLQRSMEENVAKVLEISRDGIEVVST